MASATQAAIERDDGESSSRAGDAEDAGPLFARIRAHCRAAGPACERGDAGGWFFKGPLKLLHLRRCRTGTEVGIQGLREAGVLLRVPMFIL